MNLAHGMVPTTEQSREILNTLENRIVETLQKSRLNPLIVIEACQKLLHSINEKEYLDLILKLGADPKVAQEQIFMVKTMLQKENMLIRLKTELGDSFPEAKQVSPVGRSSPVTEQILPLGVLLHIAAGNAEGLPVLSVVEGLLTGNINILKLPEFENGLTVKLLLELIKAEPSLADYIYVFDYPSRDIEAIQKMAEVAEAIIIWGSDEAVSAVRKLAKPDTKIIEWGHKIGFAYVTESGMTDEALRGLAHNLFTTNQLLCNSCQGVFVDTQDIQQVYSFCEQFIRILDEVGEEYPTELDVGIRARITLELHNQTLESLYSERRIFKGKKSSIIATPDSELDISLMYRNCWAKPLTRKNLLQTLRPHKNHLMTAALLCSEEERPALSELLFKTGITRLTSGENMSKTYCGAAHDGEYALRRYTKITSLEY